MKAMGCSHNAQRPILCMVFLLPLSMVNYCGAFFGPFADLEHNGLVYRIVGLQTYVSSWHKHDAFRLRKLSSYTPPIPHNSRHAHQPDHLIFDVEFEFLVTILENRVADPLDKLEKYKNTTCHFSTSMIRDYDEILEQQVEDGQERNSKLTVLWRNASLTRPRSSTSADSVVLTTKKIKRSRSEPTRCLGGIFGNCVDSQDRFQCKDLRKQWSFVTTDNDSFAYVNIEIASPICSCRRF